MNRDQRKKKETKAEAREKAADVSNLWVSKQHQALDSLLAMFPWDQRIIVPPWWHTCVQGENANEDELFMPREELSLSAIVEKKEWCLIERSEIRQSFWTEIKERESFPRQGKCPSGQFLSLYTCMSPSGDSFFSIFRGCSNHKSTIIIAQQNLKRKISGDFFF